MHAISPDPPPGVSRDPAFGDRDDAEVGVGFRREAFRMVSVQNVDERKQS
jgi:hypothetical protein